ncbi:MAG TPA: hemolysin family protein [Dehalococcoidia bacterium]|nr:hemolysin family protein [Dehalococcoidia bacterium]
MNVALGLALFFTSVFGYAVVNSLEIAVIGANRIRVRHLAEQGSRRAIALQRLLGEQERFFASTVLLQNILVVVAATSASLVAGEVAGAQGIIAAIFITPLITSQFGELIPKVLAAHAREGFALYVALPAEAMTAVLGPIVRAQGILPGFLSRKLFGVSLETGPSVSEAELRMLIDISAESGTMAEAEAELLDRVFHFGDRRVHEVMVPRTEAIGIDRQATLHDFYAVYADAHHSRFPVWDESPDKVVGILGIKDVLSAVSAGTIAPQSPVEPLARPALFVPETKLIGELFRQMQASGDQMAIAVDEWGGTAGIVTLEQLLEEMVGQVRDELRPGEEEITPIDERTTEVDGSLSVDEARDELGIDIPEGEYDTLAGYVLSQLGHIPKVGEIVALDGWRITVEEMRGLKIELLKVTKS